MIPTFYIFLFLFLILAFTGIVFFISFWIKSEKKKKEKILKTPFPESWKEYLTKEISFYRDLDDLQKTRFENKVKLFLSDTRITGVELKITDELRLLAACSAIIPIFYFDEWDYFNLVEILIYNEEVNPNQPNDPERGGTLLGQVRPFQSRHVMLLSMQSLIRGFAYMNGKDNLGFHEFAHLIDETDGSIDGIPKSILPPSLVRPWTDLMYKEIEKIKKGRSDINPYGVTNSAEFFAVVCEYFLENPDKFKIKHPELYSILSTAFKRS
ncbi:M90 family metallopeptidase [Sporocytophaga myxococcoides]|uniref:M90 family metallopeptidase n=1 Tax=Sporocytophaga myxococcoides TaxID=153721 RepID=UPI0004294C10|nr:M90 family metallopeptidase [Sporocytophaga myxococcoides]